MKLTDVGPTMVRQTDAYQASNVPTTLARRRLADRDGADRRQRWPNQSLLYFRYIFQVYFIKCHGSNTLNFDIVQF